MFNRKRRGVGDEERLSGYDLDWPTSQRWKPNYSVPRNSLEYDLHASRDSFESSKENERRPSVPHPLSFGRSRRDMDTFAKAIRQGIPEEGADEEEFSNLKLWIETMSELYMNDLDNRARWDPRWLNVTRRERFEGLESVAISVVDYFANETVEKSELITTKKDLAVALDSRPESSRVRIIMVSDLSRFVMGVLGQLYSVDPEFWYEHLIASGYCASDSGLKLKNAAWMNWTEQETRFRHRPLPGIGQRTEWNLYRRTKAREWAHLRWGRLGLLHYLGRKGFYEDEIAKRISDGRWTIERDVVLDKYGLLLTDKRKKRAEKKIKEKKKKEEKAKKKSQEVFDVPKPSSGPEIEGTSTRTKTSNVYRPYSTFHPVLPQNPTYWDNRDLRVMAPEGMGYWSSVDKEGRKTIILVFDPPRTMQHDKTKEKTPSLTFMPRAMEFESYTDEELWRVADPDETYLDPPAPTFTKKQLKKDKKEASRRRAQAKRNKDQKSAAANEKGNDTDSEYSSDSEFDEEYRNSLRNAYKYRQQFMRDRDFARKYSLSTFDLVYRYISKIPTSLLNQNDSMVPSLLTRLSFDDLWQLLAELRLMQDHVDADLGADLQIHLLEAAGTMTRQNVAWIKSTLQELSEWVGHIKKSTDILNLPEELADEMAELIADLQSLKSRSEQTLNLLIASTGIAQSSLVIDQTSGINKLTELAFFFIPLSFITSIFSMQVAELTESPPKMWTWGLSLGLVFLVTYLIRCFLRSPSVRLHAMEARVTMLNRFTPKSRSASHRLNSVGNRAIATYLFFFLTCCVFIFIIVALLLLFIFLVHFGIWAGAAGTAIYFIITRWPEPAVLAPCFVAIVLSVIGFWASCHWADDIQVFWEKWSIAAADMIGNQWPEKWKFDRVDDEDLAEEGVKTYARQAIFFAST
ncbi:Mg2+ transporter like zinc transport [Fusarium beomiforme]|uniref:Mg2+ transporter like zinc transport n=1 Tax=Fusarium beomiforme TaxID=44412 RepID=A0A9P5DVT4_9HYPO|nr:Mg2+ transporter like zinc transport [Fusarium beomiforme]